MSAIDIEISPESIDIELTAKSEPNRNENPEERKQSVTSVGSSTSTKLRSKATLISKFQRRNNASSPSTSATNTSNTNLIARRWRSVRHAVKVSNAVSMSKKKSPVAREDSFLKKFSTRNQYRSDSDVSIEDTNKSETVTQNENFTKTSVIRPDGNFMFYWLGVLTLAVLYNLWTCIARQAFYEIHQGRLHIWISFDILCDIIYILDIVVQFRTGYLDQGLMVYDSSKLARNYLKSKCLYLDFLCLIPLDLIQFQIGVHPMIRFPRFVKIYRTFRFVHMLESRTAYPNFVRVANLTHILFLGSHWFAAFYYMISEAEEFYGDWSYPKPEGEFQSVTRKYLASLFWSTLTLTTIGDLPPPETNWEYVFVIVSYLIGVFIFATIVGQVGNVINNRNASRQEFERLLDGAKLYMQMHNVPNELQKRVQRWYDYVWTRGRMKGSDINSLGLLPDKLKTELAIHVNLETLKKVTIFQECQPEFLHDLVLKMRAYIFTPGDLICRRGEIAREMFIIADGVVEIISESGTILTQMSTGDFFGEIGILNLDGGINRRTADVRSVGYSELFVLSREDVLGALKDHPEAENIIREYGQKRLKEIEEHRQKLKTSNVSLLSQRQSWSPSSPCKGLNSLIRSTSGLPPLDSKLKGVSLNQMHNKMTTPRKQGYVLTYMKSIVSKTKRKNKKRQAERSRTPPSDIVHPVISITPSSVDSDTNVCMYTTENVDNSQKVTHRVKRQKNVNQHRKDKYAHNKLLQPSSERLDSQSDLLRSETQPTDVSEENCLSTSNIIHQETPMQHCNQNDNSVLAPSKILNNNSTINSMPSSSSRPTNLSTLQPESLSTHHHYRSIKEEPSSSEDTFVAEEQTCGTSNESLDKACCCSQVQDQIRDIEIQLGSLERMYYESVKQLKEITTQQHILLQCVQKTQHSVMEEVSPETEDTKL